jgi:hypothetical protein
MKLFKKFLIIIAIGLVPILACDTDELVELNKNPNAVTEEMDWRYFLTYSQLQTMENRYVNWRTGLIFSSLLIQHYGGLSGTYSAGSTYIRGILDHQTSYWDYYYPHALKCGAEGMRQTTTDGYKPEWTNTHNTMRIVYNMGMLYMTDYYGNIPYFSANRGIEGENFFFPTYDSQQDIYTREGIGEGEVRGGLLWELDDAASKLATAGPDPLGTADLWYGGNLGKWRKLAYSLMLREAMRIQEVDPATSLKYINKAIAGGLMTSNDDNCITKTSTGASEWINQNGYSRAMDPTDGSFQTGNRLSNTLINFLKGNNDPRLMIISGGVGPYDDCIAGTANCDKDPANQIGLPNGYDGGDDDPAVGPGKGIEWWCANDPECNAKWDGVSDIETDEFWSGLNPLLIQDDDPYIHMGYAEVCFLLAEIAQRGIASTPKSAAEHYADGIRADMNRWVIYDPSLVINEADISAYIAAHPLSAGEAGLEEIAWQHWLATMMAPNHYETFATWRRTGRPTLIPTNYPNNLTGGRIFRKFVYSSADASLNEKNYKAGATLPNSEMTKVWWDMGYDGPGNQTMP